MILYQYPTSPSAEGSGSDLNNFKIDQEHSRMNHKIESSSLINYFRQLFANYLSCCNI
jgi:hypothetical protein